LKQKSVIVDGKEYDDSRARSTKKRIETIRHGENMKIIIKNVFVLILKKYYDKITTSKILKGIIKI